MARRILTFILSIRHMRFWVLLLTTAIMQAVHAGVPVSGVVIDPQGGVIPGARVELIASDTPAMEATTDANGAFHFDRVQPDSYDVRVSFDGFEPKTMHVNVGSRSPGTLSRAGHREAEQTHVAPSSVAPKASTTLPRS